MTQFSPRSTVALAATLGALSHAASIDTWEPLKSGTAIPSAVRQSPTSADHVWLGYSNGDVYFSTNGKLATPAWSRLDSAADGHGGTVNAAPGLAVKSIAPLWSYDSYSAIVVFAGTQQGGKVWRVDHNRGGLAWTDLTSKIPYGEVLNVSLNTRAGILYLATTAGMVYSFDNGQTFTTVRPQNDPFQPPTESPVSAVDVNPVIDQAVVGTANGEVWLSFNPKFTSSPAWTRISTFNRGQNLPSQTVTSVAIDSRDASAKSFHVTYGGRISQAVWTTRTGGQFWSAVHNPNIPVYGGGFGTVVSDIGVAPAPGASTLYAMTEYGPFRSDDNGTTWFSTARWSGRNLAVEYYTDSKSDPVQDIRPMIRIRNLGTTDASIAGARLRYKFTPNGTEPLVATVYNTSWPWNSSVALSGTSGSETTAEYLVSGTQKIAAGATGAEIQSSIHKANWSASLIQSDDFSFQADAYNWNSNPKLNPWIELWLNGTKVWGANAK
ncbi:MAG: hypothetical protein IPN71_06435 [Fibrobacteres bacterium]|nr:hypothetical protein [Fibrobacterota bacterium]